MKISYRFYLTLVILIGTLYFSCRKDDEIPEEWNHHKDNSDQSGFADNEMVMFWNEKVSTVLAAPMNQPTRSRYFAIIEIAVHDALNNIKPKYERYTLNSRQNTADPDAAVASAAYWAIKGLNRQGTFPIDSWYDSCIATIAEGESKEAGKNLGKQAADAIVALRANDGFTQVLQTSTIPADGDEPGEFRPTLMLVNGVLTPTNLKRIPNWGTVMVPYVTQSNEQFRPAGPFAVNSSGYTVDFDEVKTKGALVGGIRTEEEVKMARFWSENRPSLTWNNFVREAIKDKKLDAWKTARLFALVHVSMAESINTTINSMYHFYFWRPETAIRLAATDGNENTTADPDWLPFLQEIPNTFPSPPQPGYPSSFAAYGGSTAEILRSFFGTDITSVQLSSLNLPGEPRYFGSFSQAARENSIGIIYAGWEFRKSALDGEETGKKVAAYVISNKFREE